MKRCRTVFWKKGHALAALKQAIRETRRDGIKGRLKLKNRKLGWYPPFGLGYLATIYVDTGKVRVIPWSGLSRSDELNLFIEEVREALTQPDRDGNSILSSLIYGTSLPFWEGEEKTIEKLTLLGIVTDEEYKQRFERNS